MHVKFTSHTKLDSVRPSPADTGSRPRLRGFPSAESGHLQRPTCLMDRDQGYRLLILNHVIHSTCEDFHLELTTFVSASVRIFFHWTMTHPTETLDRSADCLIFHVLHAERFNSVPPSSTEHLQSPPASAQIP